MATPSPDGRIAFKKSVQLTGPVAIVTADVFGGAIVTLQVGLFDAQNNLLGGIGGPGQEPAPDSSFDGTARWLFKTLPGTSYIKWGIRAFRSASNGSYTATGKIWDADGTELAAGRFGGKVPDGKLNDIVVFDGVMVAAATEGLTGIPSGPAT